MFELPSLAYHKLKEETKSREKSRPKKISEPGAKRFAITLDKSVQVADLYSFWILSRFDNNVVGFVIYFMIYFMHAKEYILLGRRDREEIQRVATGGFF